MLFRQFAEETPSLTQTPLLDAKMPVLGLVLLIGAHPWPRTAAPGLHLYLRIHWFGGTLGACVCGMASSPTWYKSVSPEAGHCCSG